MHVPKVNLHRHSITQIYAQSEPQVFKEEKVTSFQRAMIGIRRAGYKRFHSWQWLR